jgi:hypothetical protein
MTITARYSGKCSKCGGRINAGETIEWEKGSGASHVTCPEHKTETLKTVSVPAELTHIEYMVGCGSTGALYRECGDRTDEFLNRAADRNKITIDEVRARLLSGKSVDFDYVMDSGPYDIRDGAIVEAMARNARIVADEKRAEYNKTHKRYRCRECGATGYAGQYPFSTNPGSGLCDDCH